jgi:hypothetical protein
MRLGLLNLVMVLIYGALEHHQVGFVGLLREGFEPLTFTPALIDQLLEGSLPV